MATKLGVFNSALIALGSNRTLASLNDPVEWRRALENVWDNEFVEGCLEQGEWNFALRTVKSEDDPPAPAFGYLFRHEKPEDWRRTVKISAQPSFDPPLDFYSDEGGYWYVDYDELYIQYVSSHPSYGGAIGSWPKSFTRYVELELACQVAPRILSPQEAMARLNGPTGLIMMAQAALRSAKSKDANNQPPEFPPRGSWVRSRRNDGWNPRGQGD